MVISVRNIPWAKEFFNGMGMKVVMGIHYLGFFLRGTDAQTEWIWKEAEGWTGSVQKMAEAAPRHMQ